LCKLTLRPCNFLRCGPLLRAGIISALRPSSETLQLRFWSMPGRGRANPKTLLVRCEHHPFSQREGCVCRSECPVCERLLARAGSTPVPLNFDEARRQKLEENVAKLNERKHGVFAREKDKAVLQQSCHALIRYSQRIVGVGAARRWCRRIALGRLAPQDRAKTRIAAIARHAIEVAGNPRRRVERRLSRASNTRSRNRWHRSRFTWRREVRSNLHHLRIARVPVDLLPLSGGAVDAWSESYPVSSPTFC
jgi:hypothetical protein